MLQISYEKYESDKTMNGLYQWDYGQIIKINGIDANEVHFQKNGKSVVCKVNKIGNGFIVKIPDVLLRDSNMLIAYMYEVNQDYGKTLKILRIPIIKRARPEDYGGDEEGYSIFKVLSEQIKNKSDDLSLSDGYLQLMSDGVPIGKRIRLQLAVKEIELRNNGIAIQWRYTDSNEWIDLIKIEDLQGPPGKTPLMEMRNGHLYAIYD
ncbi:MULTISPECIES: hypothetical protein [Bacillota]|jgi:hypothetical protein|uniref:hypothetical protein n=1 Tax=Bacillota TaxID=1239 RepID=UPI000E42723F|nr:MULTISPECIES: hypothetical protein [Bacillota]RGB58599.1 hypothetical protein DW271_02625 [Absiella sp. AM22-9]DAY77837.1 MAG TPA: hypothetical protein [Caudoviricetes sp.]